MPLMIIHSHLTLDSPQTGDSTWYDTLVVSLSSEGTFGHNQNQTDIKGIISLNASWSKGYDQQGIPGC